MRAMKYSTHLPTAESLRHADNVGGMVSRLISHSIWFVLDEDATWTADICQ